MMRTNEGDKDEDDNEDKVNDHDDMNVEDEVFYEKAKETETFDQESAVDVLDNEVIKRLDEEATGNSGLDHVHVRMRGVKQGRIEPVRNQYSLRPDHLETILEERRSSEEEELEKGDEDDDDETIEEKTRRSPPGRWPSTSWGWWGTRWRSSSTSKTASPCPSHPPPPSTYTAQEPCTSGPFKTQVLSQKSAKIT